MHEVYTTQRPGKPRWALGSAALLLLLTVMAAEGLLYYRTHAMGADLGASQDVPDGSLRVRLPAAWRQIAPDERPPGTVVAVQELPTGNRPGGRLFVFRAAPRWVGIPSLHGLDVALSVASVLGADLPVPGHPPEHGSVGPLPAVTLVTTSPGVGFGAMPAGEPPTSCLSRVGIGPGGEVVGVVLETRRPTGFRDRQLLDKVSRSIELLELSVDMDPGQAMVAAGMRFDPPAGARFIGPVDPGVARVRLMGGQANTVWYLDVYRVALIGQRTCSSLVQDHALSVLEEVRLREPIESVRVGDRETAWTALSVLDGRAPTVFLMATRTDERTALLMIARHEADAQSIVRSLCRAIAESAQVTSYGERIDVDRALDTGRRYLRQIAKDGLKTDFGVLAGKVERFLVRSPGMKLGVETSVCKQAVGADGDRWELTTKYAYQLPGRPARTLESIDQYTLANDGLAYAHSFRRLRDGQPQVLCEERRDPGASRLTRSVTTLTADRKDTIEVDDTFACEVVGLRVAARMAREPQPVPVIISTTDTYARGMVYCVLTPVGRTRLPGGPLRESAQAVRIQRDYDPAPVVAYFDETGVFKAFSYDGGQWSEPLAGDAEEVPAAETSRSPRHRTTRE